MIGGNYGEALKQKPNYATNERTEQETKRER